MLDFLLSDIKAISSAIYSNEDISFDNGAIKIGQKLVYTPSLTAKDYHADDSRVRLIMGAIRSGKSSASCAEIVARACAMQPCKDGVRRLRVAVIRNTYPDLETTTIQTWKDWWGRLGKVETRYDSPITFSHKFNDGKGDIELLLWFLALDKEKDIRKLLSLEVTFAYCNELRELSSAVFTHLRGRVGQYPRKEDLMDKEKGYWYGIIADTNPPDTDHWLYRLFEVDKPKGFVMFKQPPALIKDDNGGWVINPLAENINNLPKNYYQELMIGTPEEYQKVYVLGEYGIVYDGKPVYPNYNDDLHSKQDAVNSAPGDVIVGWDFGLTPAAVICELVGAKLYVLKEFVTERMYPDELIKIVSDWINMRYKGRTIISTCDPSGSEMYLAELAKVGLPTIKAHTNEIEPRISAVNYFLTRLDGGQPAFVLDRQQCATLRKGFLGKYCYQRVRVVGEERYRDMPDKSHPISDCHDALQYICLNICRKLNINNSPNKLAEELSKNFAETQRLKRLMYGGR